MRASDIVRGKIQSLRNKLTEEKPAATGDKDGLNQNNADPIESRFQKADSSSDHYETDYRLLDFTGSATGPLEKVKPELSHSALNSEGNNGGAGFQEEKIEEPMNEAAQEGSPQHTIHSGPIFEENRQDVRALYKRAQAYLSEIREKIRNNEQIDINPSLTIIQNVIELHYDMDAEIYQMTVDFGHGDDYFFSHAINTTIYAVRIGQSLGYNEQALRELGLAALHCDIGMFKIPDSILNKQGKLSQKEIDLVKSHPKLSMEILMPFREEHPGVVEVVYQHQERENGQGYPSGLRGNEISEMAKVIGICDSYEAMTHNRPHKKALMQADSIRELIGSKNQLFSPKIIKTFLDEISIFPIGSFVRLNNKNIGRVIATSRSNPLKPTIRVLYDENGKKITETKIVDLKANPVLNIEGSVSQDELPG